MSQEKKQWDILDIAAQASKFIETHFKKALVIFGVAIIGAGVWSYSASVAKQKQKDSFKALFAITKNYTKKKDDFAKAKQEAEAEKSKKDDKQAKKGEEKKEDKKTSTLAQATGDITKDYGAEVEQLNQFISRYKDSKAAAEAALTLSEIYDEYDMPEKGAEILGTALKQNSEKDILYYVMQMRSGDLWASANNCEKAVSYWQVVAGSDSFIGEQAQLKLGVCLQELGRYDEAKNWFEKIKAKSPNSAEGFSAKRYLRFIQFKEMHKEAGESDNKAQKDSKNGNSESPS
ncbi:MAG: tetratricopeptide repeat protein [Pseudomonadota bacterium]